MIREHQHRFIFLASLLIMLISYVWFFVKPSDAPPTVDHRPLAAPEHNTQSVKLKFIPVENSRFNIDQLELFSEVAFDSEHEILEPLIRKWTSDIVVRVEGAPTPVDRETVSRLLNDLALLQGEVRLREDSFDANLIVRFQPESTFHEVNQNYQPNNPGYFWLRWINNEIYRGTILIDSEGTTQSQRDALITEELTQAMGLMNASNRFPESIFNDDNGILQESLAEIDKEMVRMLYTPGIKPSMKPEEAMNILSNLKADPDDPEDT